VCNDGPTDNIEFFVVEWGCVGSWRNIHWKFDVDPDYRAQFRVTNHTQECSYTARVQPSYNGTSPTYSLGLASKPE
jgi:hypothetical protein